MGYDHTEDMKPFWKSREGSEPIPQVPLTELTALKGQYDTLQSEYAHLASQYEEGQRINRGLQEQTATQTIAIRDLETRIATAEREHEELVRKHAEIPNRERITAEAIRELAKTRSDEGYDTFLKGMVAAVVEQGITAYNDSIGTNLRSSRSSISINNKLFPPVENIQHKFIEGFCILNQLDKPQVNIIAATYPFIDGSAISGFVNDLRNEYETTDPHIRLRFWTVRDTDDLSGSLGEKARQSLPPTDWKQRLESEKNILLQAYAFGFIASYYQDLQAHPDLPGYLEGIYFKQIEVPTAILAMQEQARLSDNQTLLHYLHDCTAGNQRFAAEVLSHFNKL